MRADFDLAEAGTRRSLRTGGVHRCTGGAQGAFGAGEQVAGRFAKATDVGAYLGLTPRRYQSGEIDYSGRISKRGNSAMRTLLCEAATALITRVRRFSPL